ncbi:hypothetical protein C2I36_04630 [Rhodobacteraceae bacterium WD3A24]|nr:hypothetical protein C2I36_04630 [Rhodobacteraceae bacterium WD3A24]
MGCESYRKSIKREALEGEFEELLSRPEPSGGLFRLVRAMSKDAWNMRAAQASEVVAELKASVRTLDKQIDQLLDRIVETGNTSVVRAYEKKVAKLEREKVLAQEKLAETVKPKHTFEESCEHALRFLASPWKNVDLSGRKTVLRLAFSQPLPYCRKEGLRTPDLAFPFKALAGLSTPKSEMAHRGGFEPPTP